MSDRISRRQFVKTGAAASVAATALPKAATGQGPSVLVRKATPPRLSCTRSTTSVSAIASAPGVQLSVAVE